MDIFSLNPINENNSLQFDNFLDKYCTFIKGLPEHHVLKYENGEHYGAIRSRRKVQPIGVSTPRYAYSIRFPITNNEWTIGLFKFLIQIENEYWIISTFSHSFVSPNLFIFDVTNPHNGFPFIMLKRDY